MKKGDEYGTPKGFFDELDKRFRFELDPCAWPANALGTPNFYTKVDDGLKKPWAPGPVFMNPPYSTVEPWVRKAHEESLKGVLVVGLVRHDPSTRWWNTWVKGKAEIIPVPYRIHFMGGDGAYNFPSVVVVWHGLWL